MSDGGTFHASPNSARKPWFAADRAARVSDESGGGDKPVAHASPMPAGGIVLSGRGDDPAWALATPVAWESDYAGRPTGIVTRARFLYSPEALYVLWELESADLNVDASRARDVPRDKLYEEDCVEIFLTPDPSRPWRYYEMEVGPLGHFWDLDIDRQTGTSDTTWTSRARIATKAEPATRRATIESAFAAPEIAGSLAPGARLPLGLFRMEGRAPRQYLAWSPPRTPKPSFHVPEAFGFLVLDAPERPLPFGATLR
jgi:hypothetical protein